LSDTRIVDWFVSIRWGARKETSIACAHRLSRFIDDIKAIDFRLSQWYLTARRKKAATIPLPQRGALEEYLRSHCVQRKEVPPRNVSEDLGFSISLWTGRVAGTSASLVVRCGVSNSRVRNACTLTPASSFGVTRQELVDIVKCAVDAWQPDSVVVSSDEFLTSYMAQYTKAPQLGWLTYVSPSPRRLTDALPTVATTRSLGPGLLLDFGNRFLPAQHQHLAEIHQLEQRLQQLGVLPIT